MKIYLASIYQYVPYEPDILIWENYYLSSAKAEEAIAIEQAKIESNPDKWENDFTGASQITVKGETFEAGITCIDVIE